MIRVSRPVPLADRFAVRASIAYKGSWVRRTRSLRERQVRSQGGRMVHVEIIGSLGAGKPLATQLATQVGELPGAELRSWLAESCFGSYPLAMIASSAFVRRAYARGR